MAYLVRMPKLGMEMQEGELLEWKVDEGDRVEADAVVAEIESEKSVQDVPARESGVLRRRLLEPGATVSPGTPVGVVAGADEPIDDLLAEAAAHEETPDLSAADDDAPPAVAGGDGAAAKASPRARRRAEELGVDLDGIEGTGMEGSVIEADVERVAGASAAPVSDDAAAGAAGTGAADAGSRAEEVMATPDAERRASELDVPLAAVDGTGPAGTVRVADVEDFARSGPDGTADRGEPEPAETTGRSGPATRTVAREEAFSGMRQTIAERLGRSWREAPHVTVSRDVPAGEAVDAAAAADDALDVDVSVVDVLLLALSETLDAHSAFNATLEDGVHTVYEEHNVGLAVDVEAGLVTPVLDRVDERSLPELATRRRELTDRVRDGDYTMDDMQGGTFTVSNLGVLGVDAFTPIINPPEVAILGVNRLREVPVPAPDRDGVGVERRMRLDLSFDHRAVDGADAARFLETLVERLAEPWHLLLSRQ